MKKVNIKVLSICMGLSFTPLIVFSNEPEKGIQKKVVEKIEVKVKDTTHIVYVNKTMINMFKNSQANESFQSSTITFPAGYSTDSFALYWYSFIYNRWVEEKEAVADVEMKQ